jgi:hypothetical protein
MARFFMCCVAVFGLSLSARAGELDREAARAGPAALVAKASVLDAKPVAGTEMDKEAPQQSRRYGGWGWGGRGFAFGGWGWGGRGFAFGGWGWRGRGFAFGGWGWRGRGFGFFPSVSYAFYAPFYTGCDNGLYFGGW